MLTAEQNKFFVEVGPDKPMGKLLRRYWIPFAGASELDNEATKPVRLLCEDLVVYKDLSGNYGLIDRQCPHRRADLSYGYVEACGLRCNYHGWLFDADGKCVEQPYEDLAHPEIGLKDKVKIKSYPVRECAGLLFAYMGPLPAPELPVWAPFTWKGGFREIVRSDIPCNWFQCQENSIDPVHFEWMHDNWTQRLAGSHDYSTKHLQVAFDELDYGFAYRRIREGQEENSPLWTIGRLALWPIGFYLGEHFEWRVPVDDENTLSLAWFHAQSPSDAPPFEQKSVGGAGNHRRPHEGVPRRERPRHRDDAPPLRRGLQAHRGRPRPQGRDPRSRTGEMRAPGAHWPHDRRGKPDARGMAPASLSEIATEGPPPLLRPAEGGARGFHAGHGVRLTSEH